MFAMRTFNSIAASVILAGGANLASAQGTFHRTLVVDQDGYWDHTSIQAAINSARIGDDPQDRWTILIYAGRYTEALALNDLKENIDLVGVDPDAVIIKPPAGSDAVTIEGFGARNNTLRNLTIITDGAGERGVVLKRPDQGGGDNPSAIRIDGVRIQTHGANSSGIYIKHVGGDLEIVNSTVETLSADSHCLFIAAYADGTVLRSLRITGSRLVEKGGSPAAGSSDALRVSNPVEGLLLRNVLIRLEGVGFALNLLSGVAASQDIELDTVTVRSTAPGNTIEARNSSGLRITNCNFLDADGTGILVGDDARITGSSIIVDKDVAHPPVGLDDTSAIRGDGISGLRVSDCTLRGRQWGIRLENNCTDVVVSNSGLVGTYCGVWLECGDGIVFQNCRIGADSRRRLQEPVADYHGIFIDGDGACQPGVIEFVSCDIRAWSGDAGRDAFGVLVNAAPGPCPLRLSDCVIASEASSAAGRSFGVVAREAEAVALRGGSVRSLDQQSAQEDQFDVKNEAPSGLGIRLSGAQVSKWKGPIGPAGSPKSVVQRTVNVAAPSDTAILPPTSLNPTAGTIVTTGITDPDVYRVLKLKRNHTAGSQTATIVGSNFAGAAIAEQITIPDTRDEQAGLKPFRSVSTIILPPGPAENTISVGTTSRLGLYFPISGATAVQQQGRQPADADSYVIEPLGTVDATYATVDVGQITSGDSFEWSLLASE